MKVVWVVMDAESPIAAYETPEGAAHHCKLVELLSGGALTSQPVPVWNSLEARLADAKEGA